MDNRIDENETEQELQLQVNKLCGFKTTLHGLALGLMAEVGETADVIGKLSGTKKPKSGDDLEDLQGQLRLECADVLVYLLQIANEAGFDLKRAYLEKIQILLDRHTNMGVS